MIALRLGLVGRDIAHSLSPDLHQAALSAMGLGGSYRLIDCPDEAAARAAIAELRAGGWDGLNVTTPYKALAAEACDMEGAAVNTLWRAEGRLAGCSTDGVGLLAALASVGVDVQQMSVGLLGTGGAALAIAEALRHHGARVDFVAGRSPEAASAIAERCDARALTFGAIAAQDVRLMIHCSRLGHGVVGDGAADAEAAATLAQVFGPGPGRGLYVDIVYARQGETLFERAGRQAGARVVPGVGLRMLIAQAAASFARFAGHEPPLLPMARAVGVAWSAPSATHQL